MKRIAFVISLFFACTATDAQQKDPLGKLKLIGEYEVPHNLPFKGTTVGGLSGIDYDKTSGLYYLICDDRSAINPARFYTAKLFFDEKKVDSAVFVNVTTLLQPNGNPYPNSKQDPSHTPDPEALRYNPISGQMIWSSEGERIVRAKDTILENPAITIVSPDGTYIDTFPLPENLKMHFTENGPRQNGVLEGLSFANNYQTLYVNVEEPLYEDGPRADLMRNNAFIRIFKFDVLTKQNTAQYAYELDPVAYPTITPGAFKINGIPDILDAGDDKLIVLERSFSTGRLPCTIKIFLADLKGATDIKNNPSLKQNPAAQPIQKQLLLNMDSLGIYVDNVEGITFGPTLPNGHRTLVLVSDNNFEVFEKTQFFVFEIIPE
ncbi:MAG: esterase-like activity of phytase family protein [Bacteroidota bacterium]